MRRVTTLFIAFVLAMLPRGPALAVPYGPNSFLVAGFGEGRITVYDENFVFQGVFEPDFRGPIGLDFTPSGGVIAGTHNPSTGSMLRHYAADGTVLATIAVTNGGAPVDVKYGPGGHAYVGAQAPGGVREYRLESGAWLRGFGTDSYDSVAVLPGGVLWAGGNDVPGRIDVFDIASTQHLRTIALDGGQAEAESMYYSPLTNTVLTTAETAVGIYERDLEGNLLRTFIAPGMQPCFGVTRGPGGDVFATDVNNGLVRRWRTDGTYVRAYALAPQSSAPTGIIWAGNVPEPGAVALMTGVAALVLAQRRQR